MAKSETVRIRLDKDEKKAFQRAAELSGLTLSTWIREKLRRATRIELEDAGEKIPFIRPRKED
jgi:antitoxin component of RelBE/YafQ-DinJ toxin-antitoxin module